MGRSGKLPKGLDMTINVIPVTDFRKQAKDILGKIREMPVVLTQRSYPVAMVVDYETYQEREERLEKLELALDDLILARAIQSAEEFVSLDGLLAELEGFSAEETSPQPEPTV